MEARHISGPLMVGIILLPVVFYWFLLRPGYSSTSRVAAGLYLAVCVAFGVFQAMMP